MQNIKLKLKKKPLLFILLLLIVITVGTTVAYFYSEIVIPNNFKTMTYNVTVEEEFYDDWGTKKVSFQNKETTNTPVVIRINYNEAWRKKITEDVSVLIDNNVGGTNVVNKNWTADFNDNFIKGEDGWYYYKKVLKSQESVQVLESISLNEELISTSPYYKDYQVATYELAFNFEAIQADKKAIKDIWEKDIEISGDEISWSF